MTNKLVARPRARKIQLSGRSIQKGGGGLHHRHHQHPARQCRQLTVTSPTQQSFISLDFSLSLLFSIHCHFQFYTQFSVTFSLKVWLSVGIYPLSIPLLRDCQSSVS